MAALTKEMQQHLLGQQGERTIRRFFTNQLGWGCEESPYVLDDRHDLIVYPDPSDKSKFMEFQIKTKVPWFTENAISFEPKQWIKYRDTPKLGTLVICAGSDKWSFLDRHDTEGKVFLIHNKEDVETFEGTTKEGRVMTLISISSPYLEEMFRIEDKRILDIMRRFATDES